MPRADVGEVEGTGRVTCAFGGVWGMEGLMRTQATYLASIR